MSVQSFRTPQDVYADYAGRRRGILAALTTDVDAFYDECNPARENLCLYGHPDGSWQVALPAEEVPPEMPEPALGINFARDGMQKRDWLSLVAVHSDTWLLAVAFYHGARLNADGRQQLFDMINQNPTCYEILSSRAAGGAGKKRAAGGPPAKPQAKPARPGGSRGPPGRYTEYDEDDEYEEGYEEEDAGNGDGDNDPCPNCGRVYRQGDFWIACDFCDTWFDGKCVGMTAQKAEKGRWKCPLCIQGGK